MMDEFLSDVAVSCFQKIRSKKKRNNEILVLCKTELSVIFVQRQDDNESGGY